MSLYDIRSSPHSTAPPACSPNEKGKVTLLVNVASFCGLTPQYEGLEQLDEKYGARASTSIGIPCNQFGEQEPGTPDEIKTFCSTNYGVTFPLTEKIEVNGDGRHPLYQAAHARRPTPRATPATSAGTSRSSSSAATARSWRVLADGRARGGRGRRARSKRPWPA